MTELLVWDFLPADGRIANEGTLVVPGQTLRLPAGVALELCAVGYHGSIKALDALHYAPGPVVQRAALSGDVLRGTDKACASERTCIAVADATAVLWEFACWCAGRALMRERNAEREPDARSWAVVAARRAWLRGEITDAQLVVAGRDARAAAKDAAYAAIDGTAFGGAAYATYAAAWAAVYAARSAADKAAWAAAWAAAYAARAAAAIESAVQNAELEARLCALLGAAV